ncbi:dihydroorotate dehydrogenase [Tepiditoga spiralis]|uniref:Dihydroorotate dehydrogenase n=1 Tax=Tepiditoga spiralis TaxID=2108365 RepID=A0A7G1G975_9BACT|nr:dihydroorotate dehydrogenase [Tepiditoga spiralis]BBE32016.1 dihydroorotate dehydrogenase [Tepiditoga spiralis]
MERLKTKVCGITFNNPVITASGPSGNGEELNKLIDISKLGGFTSKTITLNSKIGNPPPRIINVDGGMLNSIGLQNDGYIEFKKNTVPFLESLNTNIIASLGGYDSQEFEIMIKELNSTKIKAFELNLSCPNVSKGGAVISQNPNLVYEVVKNAKKISKKPIFVKFGIENVDELVENTVAAGADGVTLINCIKGMKIDINTGKTILKRKIGGLSGPAIKPIALATVYKIKNKYPDLSIIGMGGIMNFEDALEFMMAGASLVGIGTGVMIDHEIPVNIIKNLNNFLLKKNKKLDEIFSSAQEV